LCASAPGCEATFRSPAFQRLVDVRLNCDSQLAGFAKAQDLPFFLRELCGAEYLHEPLLAPAEDLFQDYRKKAIDWHRFEERFLGLLAERQVEKRLSPALFDVPTVLL